MLKVSHLTLTREIRDAIQLKAKDCQTFKERDGGAIRISFFPYCKAADDWLGGLGHFTDLIHRFNGKITQSRNPPCYEFSFGITPGGSQVIPVVGDGGKQQRSCYAYSAMKAAHASRALYEGRDYRSGDDLYIWYLKEDNGYAAQPGALGFIIEHEGNLFCDIVVCVSGATPVEDETCAAAAIRVIEELFSFEKDFKVISPRLHTAE